MVFINEVSKAFRISRGDTLNISVKLYDNAEPPIVLTPADYAVLKIRDRQGKLLYETHSPIVDNAFPFILTNEQSEALPPGMNFYDFAIYTNAALDPDGVPIDGDHVLTPYGKPADFFVGETINRD